MYKSRVGLSASVTSYFTLAVRLGGLAPTLSLDFLSGSLDSRITFTRGTTATFVGSNGLIQSAAINTPRFDYDPVTLAPKGLLIEEQRTNLLVRSVEFDNAAWAKSVLSVTANTATAPDGTLSADKLIADTTAAVHTIGQNIAVVSGTTMTGSVYAKAGEYNFAGVLLLTTFAAPQIVICNLSTGTISSSSGSPLATSITAVGNGWYRISITQVTNATGTATMQVRPTNVGNTTFFTGDGTSGIYVWGAQIEAGAFATSYIPTVASTVTRSADAASMTGTNFSDWYNQSEGTFTAEADTLKPSGFAQTANLNSANDGTSSNAVSLRFGTSNATGLVQTGGTAQTGFAGTAYTANTPVKWGMAYQLNNTALSVAGGAVTTDTSVTVGLTMTQMNIGARNGALDPLNGHIRRIAYYPTRLADYQLQGLTA